MQHQREVPGVVTVPARIGALTHGFVAVERRLFLAAFPVLQDQLGSGGLDCAYGHRAAPIVLLCRTYPGRLKHCIRDPVQQARPGVELHQQFSVGAQGQTVGLSCSLHQVRQDPASIRRKAVRV